MEFGIVNTPCPGYKTLKRRYTFLEFPRVNTNVPRSKIWLNRRKSSAISNLPKMTSSSLRLSTEMLLSRNQDKTCFQKLHDTLQEKSKCSTDSTSVWQKAQDGDSTKPKRNSFSFVKTIRFKILN